MIKICSLEKPVDFLLYIGDEPHNERVFHYLNSLLKTKDDSNVGLAENAIVYSCTIGRKVTQANFFVSSPETILKLLNRLPEKK